MKTEESIKFIKSILIKVENVINLIDQDVPKHIPAYNKMLGIQQKFTELDGEDRAYMIPQLITTRLILNYFMNGRYSEGNKQILKLKKELINICFSLEKNERDKE